MDVLIRKENEPDLFDIALHLQHWTSNTLKIGQLVLKRGPLAMLQEIRRYPWIAAFLNINNLLDKILTGRTGTYREANAIVISEVVTGMLELLEEIFYSKGNLVLHEDMVPPEILRAMGLNLWMPELMGILGPIVDPRSMEKYIDIAENEGIPPDICSLPKAVMGMAFAGHLPPAVACVASNMPCDGGMASYTIIEQKYNLPMFRLDIPHNFKDDKAVEYFVKELKRMIAWLEEHTSGRMDWDKLREICEERNKAVEYELELWDMLRLKPAPMAAEPVYLSHLFFINVFPGDKKATRAFKKVAEITKKNIKQGKQAVKNEKYRALLWNPPTMVFFDLFIWAEQRYGVSLIMDSMSYNNHPFIDTTDNDSMLRDLSKIIMNGPMARHTRGPAENYLSDIFHIYETFDLDMVWVAGHIGCKNTQALNGMLREKCREKGIPLLIIEYDLSDLRIVSREGMQNQVDNFMTNIMKAEILVR